MTVKATEMKPMIDTAEIEAALDTLLTMTTAHTAHHGAPVYRGMESCSPLYREMRRQAPWAVL